MRIAFYDVKPYDKPWFDRLAPEYGCEIKYLDYHLNADTARFSEGCGVACAFVNDVIDKDTLDALAETGVKLIAMRCAGYNNVDLKAACYMGFKVVRVPEYSPAAVAEHTMALLLCVNRKIHRAYSRTRENNFSINGLIGFDMRGKTAGIIGTGKIGRVFAEICGGFGMKVIAYDPYPSDSFNGEYKPIDSVYRESDVISLHCPLIPATRHMINKDSIALMKDGVVVVNTSRGGLIDTPALIDALKSKKFYGAGLDVYEEEADYFFSDYSAEIITDDDLARLLSFPNVVLTSHQAFFTEEATREIAETTLKNIQEFNTLKEGRTLVNEICCDNVKRLPD
ncbi:MAG: 2-hydroxyacid dehydrogenase [Oscillospiraceae bacterium]|nr:2-hydroxyacid dehydrogenase [Oscillospiraceae bacterium]